MVGHRNYQDPLLAVKDDVYFRENNERIQHICDMNDLFKPIEDIIKRHNDFFSNLKDVGVIEILGHSCNEIDRAYFREIRFVVSDHVQWIFHYHTNNDKKSMLSMVDELSIKDFDLKFI